MLKKGISYYIRIAIGWILSLLILIPFALIIINSLKTEAEADLMNLAWPKEIQWSNYVTVLKQGNSFRSFLNSTIVSVGCTVLCTLFASMASFIMVRRKNRFNKMVDTLFFLGLIAPINYVTVVKTLKFFHLMNTYQGLILLNVALGIPFAVFLINGFISTIPLELDEAAIIDGCGTKNLFFRVVFPLLKPVTITAAILTFMSCWNDFITPLYVLNESKKWGMILSVYNYFGTYSNQWHLVSAIIIVTLIPILVLYICAQKYIIAGMTSGAVKG